MKGKTPNLNDGQDTDLKRQARRQTETTGKTSNLNGQARVPDWGLEARRVFDHNDLICNQKNKAGKGLISPPAVFLIANSQILP